VRPPCLPLPCPPPLLPFATGPTGQPCGQPPYRRLVFILPTEGWLRRRASPCCLHLYLAASVLPLAAATPAPLHAAAQPPPEYAAQPSAQRPVAQQHAAPQPGLNACPLTPCHAPRPCCPACLPRHHRPCPSACRERKAALARRRHRRHRRHRAGGLRHAARRPVRVRAGLLLWCVAVACASLPLPFLSCCVSFLVLLSCCVAAGH
jgi:hypothetical protein